MRPRYDPDDPDHWTHPHDRDEPLRCANCGLFIVPSDLHGWIHRDAEGAGPQYCEPAASGCYCQADPEPPEVTIVRGGNHPDLALDAGELMREHGLDV